MEMGTAAGRRSLSELREDVGQILPEETMNPPSPEFSLSQSWETQEVTQHK